MDPQSPILKLTPQVAAVDKSLHVPLPPHWQANTEAAQGATPDTEMLGPPSPTTASGLAPERAAQLFRAYDLLGRGWLTRTQMVAALSELSVVHGLGEKGLNEVLNQDPATSREARYTLQDFLSMYERIGLFQAKCARNERIRALSAISEPPPGAANSPALRAVFQAYCRYSAGTSRLLMETSEELRMNAQQLVRLCQDLELLSPGGPDAAPGAITFSTVDVIFAKCKTPGTGRRLTYTQWLRAVAALSDAAGCDLFAIIHGHALRLNPQYADKSAYPPADDVAHGATQDKTSRTRGKDTVSSSMGSGLPKLRQSGADHKTLRASTGTVSLQLLTPPQRPSPTQQQPTPGLPGRLIVLERALLEEEAKAAGQAMDQTKSTTRVPRSAPSSRPGSRAAQAKGGATEAWGEGGQDAHAGKGGDGSPGASRAGSPPRPRTTGSPLRATRLARISMVDSAGVATEVWKFSPARPEAWDEVPAWMAPFLQRLERLEGMEPERVAAEDAMKADVIFRTQRWEQSERMLNGKASTLESRFLALERHTADSDVLLGEMKKQVEEAKAMADQLAELKQQVAEAIGVRDEVLSQRDQLQSELKKLKEQIGESTGAWQAALAMTRQEITKHKESVDTAVKAAAEQGGGVKTEEMEALIDSKVGAMAEKLTSELQSASQSQVSETVEQLKTTVTQLQSEMVPKVEQVTAQMDQVKEEVSRLASSTPASAQELVALKTELESSTKDLTARVEELTAAVEGCTTDLRTCQDTVLQCSERYQTCQTQIETCQKDITKLTEETTAKLAELQTAAAAAAAAPAKDADSDGPSTSELGSKVAAVEAKLAAQSGEVSTQLAELSVRVDTLTKASAGQDTLSGEVKTLSAALKALEASVSAVKESNVSAAAAKPAGDSETPVASGAVKEIEAQVKALQEQLSSLSASLADRTSADMSALDKRCESTEGQIKDIEGKVAKLESALTVAANAATAAAAAATRPPTADPRLADILTRLSAAEAKLASGAAGAASRPVSAGSVLREGAEVEALKGQVKMVQSQLGIVNGDINDIRAAIGRAEAAAAAAGAQATAAQAAAAEAVSQAASQPAAVTQQTLDSRLAALTQELTAKLAERAQAPTAGDLTSKVSLLEAALAQTATKFSELEAGMQALAAAALDAQRKAPSGSDASIPPDLVERVAKLEASVSQGARQSLAQIDEAHAGTQDGDVPMRGASRDGTAGAASKRDLENLKMKVMQMTTLVENVKDKVSKMEAAGGAGGGAGDAKPAAGGMAAPQAAAAMQMAQMQVMQQVAMLNSTLQQLSAKVTAMEGKQSSGSPAQEALHQATSQQLNLVQGAIVQLSGEVNQLKLAVPQLSASIKAAMGGSDAASVTAAVARGEYGPVLAAVAEELQRNSVRLGNMESDMRISMTTLAKAADLSQMELVLGSRIEKLEEAVEDQRRGGGGAGMGGGGARVQTAMPGAGAAGGAGADPTGHKFATWDALKHAEAALTKTQQQAKDEMVRIMNTINDVSRAVLASEEKLGQRLDVKEKVLMRMANEVDSMKTAMSDLAAKVNAPPPTQGRSGATLSKIKTNTTHRMSMFDD